MPNSATSKARSHAARSVRHRRVPLHVDVAAVLVQKVQEALVIALLHVEQRHEHPIVAARLTQAERDDLAQRAPREIARNERLVHDRPERFGAAGEPREQFFVNRRRRWNDS